MITTIRAYHFVGPTLRDGRPVPADGEKLVFPGRPILCEQGLHASVHPADALTYAPGATLCLVDVGGTVVTGKDKLAGTERTIIRRIDATELLLYFARLMAIRCLDHWRDNPPNVVLDYLMTGDPGLWSAARDAAQEEAGRCVEESPRGSPAESAAWSAWWATTVVGASWAAARSAASEAAHASAMAASRAAAEAAEESVVAAGAASVAAWTAARAEARDLFAELVRESLG